MTDLPWDKSLEEEEGFSQAITEIASTAASENAWNFLWEKLIHQYDIDDKSIKAAPLLVAVAKQLSREHRYQHMVLLGSIAYCSQLPGSRWVLESAPEGVRHAYQNSLDQAAVLLAETMAETWNSVQTHSLLLSYAALRRIPRLADYLDRYDVEVSCPQCGFNFETPNNLD